MGAAVSCHADLALLMWQWLLLLLLFLGNEAAAAGFRAAATMKGYFSSTSAAVKRGIGLETGEGLQRHSPGKSEPVTSKDAPESGAVDEQ
jgi:hypothetical protein